MLDEKSIRAALSNLVNQVRLGSFRKAMLTLQRLNLDRLRYPVETTAEGNGTWINPAEFFGVERVTEVGMHLDAVRDELRVRNRREALENAEKALSRWLEDVDANRMRPLNSMRK